VHGLQPTVDYDRLVHAYKDSLVTTLRGFTPGADFLALWVPDDDHHKSILNLVESAESAGLKGVSVRIGAETARTLDVTRLESMLADFGTVRAAADGDGILLEIAYGGDADTLAIHPAYRAHVAEALMSPKHEAHLAAEGDLRLVEASCDGVNFALLVDPGHNVRRAAYGGTVTDVQRGLLEVLCGLLVDRPIQDCAEHATIYLEHRLRDTAHPHAVPGVLHPDTIDPAFRLCTRLVRDAAGAYCADTGYAFGENMYDPPPSTAWKALSRVEKRGRVEAALADILSNLGLSSADVALISVGDDNRVSLDCLGDAPRPVNGHLLMRIEAGLKVKVEETLCVYTIERKDLNKIRRLSTGQVEAAQSDS